MSPAKKSANGKDTLPASIINALPSSRAIMEHMKAVEKLIPALGKELKKAEKGGAIPVARAFVALHRLETRIDAILSPLFGEKKDAPGLLYKYKTEVVPSIFEQAGVPNVPLEEGFRVGISSRFLASIKPDHKAAAYDWLRGHGLGDLITYTVNSQTLSSALRKELEEKNIEAPEELFSVAMMPTTSVTGTK